MKMFEGVCSRCDKKKDCKTYQDNLKDKDQFLFGCSYPIEDIKEEWEE